MAVWISDTYDIKFRIQKDLKKIFGGGMLVMFWITFQIFYQLLFYF